MIYEQKMILEIKLYTGPLFYPFKSCPFLFGQNVTDNIENHLTHTKKYC